jgi:exosome complex RNA-binding protein Rrp42 (RNase PH superfamily)
MVLCVRFVPTGGGLRSLERQSSREATTLAPLTVPHCPPVSTGAVGAAAGSAMVRLGATTVVAGVRAVLAAKEAAEEDMGAEEEVTRTQ